MTLLSRLIMAILVVLIAAGFCGWAVHSQWLQTTPALFLLTTTICAVLVFLFALPAWRLTRLRQELKDIDVANAHIDPEWAEKFSGDLAVVVEGITKLNHEVEQRRQLLAEHMQDLEFTVERRTAELSTELEKINSGIAHLPAPVLHFNTWGGLEYVNQAARELLGIAEDQQVDDFAEEILDPESADILQNAMANLREGDTVSGQQINLCRPSGRVVECIGAFDFDETNPGAEVRLVLMDITSLQCKRRALKSRVAMASTFVEHSPAPVAILDNRLRCVTATEAWCRLVGKTSKNIKGYKLLESLSPPVAKIFEGALQGREGQVECEFVTAKGVAETVRWMVRPWRRHTEEIAGVVAVMEVMTLRRQHERQLRRLADVDALTDLPNRRKLYETLEKLIAEQKTFGMVFVDLDGFKSVNDEHGHLVGDKVLCRVAARLREFANREMFTARLAGDEFVLIDESTTTEKQLDSLVGQVENFMTQTYRINGTSVLLGASVGGSLAGQDDDPESLLQRADKAMYSQKLLHRTA